MKSLKIKIGIMLVLFLLGMVVTAADKSSNSANRSDVIIRNVEWRK